MYLPTFQSCLIDSPPLAPEVRTLATHIQRTLPFFVKAGLPFDSNGPRLCAKHQPQQAPCIPFRFSLHTHHSTLGSVATSPKIVATCVATSQKTSVLPTSSALRSASDEGGLGRYDLQGGCIRNPVLSSFFSDLPAPCFCLLLYSASSAAKIFPFCGNGPTGTCRE